MDPLRVIKERLEMNWKDDTPISWSQYKTDVSYLIKELSGLRKAHEELANLVFPKYQKTIDELEKQLEELGKENRARDRISHLS